MNPKNRHDEDDPMPDDEAVEPEGVAGAKDDDDEDDDGPEDVVELDEAKEEEEEDEDLEESDEELIKETVEDLEKKRLFIHEAEEALENLTLDDIREVLKDNDMDVKLAPRLKKLLSEVVEDGDVITMEEAWEEALDRLDEEI